MSFFHFSTKLMISALALAISLAFLLILPIYQYSVRENDLSKGDSKKRPMESVPIGLSQPPKKVKKLRVKAKRPKMTRSLARADRFDLDLSTSGGVGIAMGMNDAVDLIYNQSQVDSLPVRLRGRVPEVPRAFATSGQKGLVELEIIIEVDGSVSNVAVAEENPKGYGLGSIAAKAVYDWKFRPALLNGIPVRLRVIQPFGF